MKLPDLISIGMLIVFIGILIVIIGSFLTKRTDSKVAVGGFIGPIPFDFGNDKTLMYVVIGLTVFILIFSFILSYTR